MKPAQKPTYEGWSNYETWAVNLWLANDEGLYNYWRERVKELRAERGARSVMLPKTRKAIAADLAEELKAWADDAAPWDSLNGTLWADLLTAALGEVDWREIADAWLDS